MGNVQKILKIVLSYLLKSVILINLNKCLPNSVAKVIVLRGNITHLCVSPCTVLKFDPK